MSPFVFIFEVIGQFFVDVVTWFSVKLYKCLYKTLTWYVQVEKVGRDTRDLYDWKLREIVISFSSEIVDILVMAPVICYHPFLSVLKCYSVDKLKDLGEGVSKYTGVTFLCCLEDVCL